jgi:hypothetical protein
MGTAEMELRVTRFGGLVFLRPVSQLIGPPTDSSSNALDHTVPGQVVPHQSRPDLDYVFLHCLDSFFIILASVT